MNERRGLWRDDMKGVPDRDPVELVDVAVRTLESIDPAGDRDRGGVVDVGERSLHRDRAPLQGQVEGAEVRLARPMQDDALTLSFITVLP